MRIQELFSSKIVSEVVGPDPNKDRPFLGDVLFPTKTTSDLDLAFLRKTQGYDVQLSPATFDTKETIRAREGIDLAKTEMAFFRESMIVGEKEQQAIAQLANAQSPYAKGVVTTLYDDATRLVKGAYVVPERMRMQLLCSKEGSPRIAIAANGATYQYNYDPSGKYKANNFSKVGVEWSDPTSDIITDIRTVLKKMPTRPKYMLMTSTTMGYMYANEVIRSSILAQNVTANVIITDEVVKDLFVKLFNLNIVLVDRRFKESTDGTDQGYFLDDVVTFIPEGNLGNTWYGMTPEERSLAGNANADVSLIGNTGIAVAVVHTNEVPYSTKTTVSEIVLPSFERMYETYTMDVGA